MDGVGGGFVILALPFVCLPIAVIGAAIGVVWAPFAALTCAGAAGRKGLSPGRYAIAGTAFSVCGFFPAVHLSMSLNDKQLPGGLIWCGYFMLYVIVWLFGVLGYGLLILIIDSDPWPGVNSAVVRYANVAFLVVSSYLWIVSLRKLRAMNRHDKHFPPTHDWDPMLPHSAYVLPFLYASISLVLVFLIAWLSGSLVDH